MKIIKGFIAMFLMAAVVSGCEVNDDDFLDEEEVNEHNESTTFADSTLTMNFLVGIYADIGFSFSPSRFNDIAGLNVATDESESVTLGAQPYIRMVNGTLTALTVPTDAWRWSYYNIRRTNVLLKNLPNTPLSAGLKTRVAGEARFLRAWYYSIMLKHYGGVPLIGDKLYSATDIIPGNRNTYEECVNYIVSELEAAADMLPTQQVGINYGRITKGACLALQSRVLLYAASPLFNGGGITPDPELRAITGYPTADQSRWLKAAEAAKKVMDLNAYELYEDNATAPGYGFQKVFTLRVNNEYILAHMRPSNKDLENLWDAPSRGGKGNACPYQELVDAFGMINGKPILDNASGYDSENPYANRDPRFGYTILHNEGLRRSRSNRMEPAYTYVGAVPDGFPSGTKTGYYIRKMFDENTISDISAPTTQRCLPLIRYAEIMLNRAEALNEYASSPDGEVYQLLKDLRKRAGILPGPDNMYGLEEGMSQAQMREVIRNERRIELAFEEHRYWDVRRWRIAEETGNQLLHGMSINRQSNGTYNYQRVPVNQHVFNQRMYFWPIPQSEISKSLDGSLLQNPGW